MEQKELRHCGLMDLQRFHHDVYVALFDNQRPISYSISLNVKNYYIVPTRSNKIARYISRLLMYRQYMKKSKS